MAAEAPADPVRVEEPATGFSGFAPPDFALSYDEKRGVYELRSDERGVSIEHMRVITTSPPGDEARSVVNQRKFELVSEHEDDQRATVVAKRPEGPNWTVSVRRDGPETLAVTTWGRLPGATQPERPDEARVLEWVASSLSGGKAIQLPEKMIEETIKPIELEDFTTEDKTASGKIPAEPGWSTGGVGGALEADNPLRGEMHLGIPGQVWLPGTGGAAMAQMYPPGWAVSPLLPPDQAVLEVWPVMRNILQPGIGFEGFVIDAAYPQNFGAPYNAGLFAIRFKRGGAPWRGAILAATAGVPGADLWIFYYSEIAVPETDDSSVSQGLLKAWEAYNPSRSQAQRTTAAKAALAEVTQTIRSMTTMRQQSFERSRIAWTDTFRW